MSVPMIETLINGRWPLLLPEHRAARPEWPTWEKERLDSMNKNIGPDDVVYDIGAEEGDFPALWATWGAGVVLVEPNPKVWPNIRCIWQGNNLPDPLGWLVGFAAPDDEVPPDTEGHFCVDPNDAWPECAYGELIGDHGFLNLCERPDVVRAQIDSLAKMFVPPTAITIDVEGAELAVMQGAKEVLQKDRPKIWVSIHPEFSVDMYNVTKQDFLDYMHSFDYITHHLASDHEEHWLAYHKDEPEPDLSPL